MSKKILLLVIFAIFLTGCGEKDENKEKLFSINEIDSKEIRKNLSDDRIKKIVEKTYKKEKLMELISIELTTITKGTEIFTISKDEQHTYFRTFKRDKDKIKLTMEEKVENDPASDYYVDSIFPYVSNETNIIAVGIHRNPHMYLSFFLVGQLKEKEKMEIIYDNEINNKEPIYMGEIVIVNNRIVVTENGSELYYLFPSEEKIQKKIRTY
jgi:hypothetical protein